MGKDTRSPFRSVESFSKLISIPQEGIHTVEDMFNYTISKHSKLPALGTRELLSEEEEVVEGGKLFKKVTLLLASFIHIFSLLSYITCRQYLVITSGKLMNK